MKILTPILSTVAITLASLSGLFAESLTTGYGGGINEEGIMFDLLPTQPIRVTGVQYEAASAGTQTITVYAKRGTFVGSEAIPTDWVPQGAQIRTSFANNSPFDFYQFPEPIQYAAGERFALYVQSATTNGLSYTNDGSLTGDVAANDANLAIFTGSGINNAFGNAFPDRLPNVTIFYTLVSTAPPLVDLFGPRRVRTTENRFRVGGVATSDLGVASVRIRFQRLKANGSKKTVTRFKTVDSNGVFEINTPTIENGRNRVRVNATDVSGQSSATSVKVLIGKN